MDPQPVSDSFPQSPQSPILSQHDTQILNQLLSPGLVPPPANVIDSSRPGPPPSLLALEASILAPLNIERPSSSILRTAIDALSALISQHPDHASAYNNRAQAKRLLLGDDLRTNESVWTDLSTAIGLIGGGAEKSTLNSSRAQVQVSKHDASVLCKAYTQRAWLLWKLARTSPVHAPLASSPAEELRKEANEHDGLPIKEPSSHRSQLPAQLLGLSREDIEELASRDFAMGGMYGDESARSMAVRTSPYAKLCGAIVKEAMKEEMSRDGRGAH